MVSFDMFSISEGSPIYMQIIRYIKRGVVSGSISDGDELPSRRVLSALLGVNPNTVQKAFRILEDEELIESRSGAKSYLTLTPGKTELVRAELLRSELSALVSAVKQSGIDKRRALELIEKLWDGGMEP